MTVLEDLEKDFSIEVGKKAPDFILCTEKGVKWRLSEQYGKVTALLFYPKNETLVCTRQLCSLRNNWAKYSETKATIIGISPDTSEENLHFSQHYHLPLPILADSDRAVTKIYASHWLLPIQLTRAVVIVDAKGYIRHREVMLRVFRPTDKSIIASIYAARTDFIYEHFKHILKESKEKNERLI